MVEVRRPLVLDQVREGLQLYGRRASWEDPLAALRETWPWSNAPLEDNCLVEIRPEDVGYDITSPLSDMARPVSADDMVDNTQEDPLFNMLMTLQEAANTQAGDL